jgi:hypothetical protein
MKATTISGVVKITSPLAPLHGATEGYALHIPVRFTMLYPTHS